MAKLEYFIVCESASVDSTTNRISLFNVLEDIFPEDFPNELFRIDAVSLWNLDPEDEGVDFQATLIVKPPGEPGVDFSMNLSRGSMKYRAIVGIRNIPLLAPGKLEFEVRLNGGHEASHTVKVHEVGAVATWEKLQK